MASLKKLTNLNLIFTVMVILVLIRLAIQQLLKHHNSTRPIWMAYKSSLTQTHNFTEFPKLFDEWITLSCHIFTLFAIGESVILLYRFIKFWGVHLSAQVYLTYLVCVWASEELRLYRPTCEDWSFGFCSYSGLNDIKWWMGGARHSNVKGGSFIGQRLCCEIDLTYIHYIYCR